MNLPNKLTVLRVLLIPIFIYILMTGHYYAAAIIFIVASLTDLLDGAIARKYKLITNFGKIMDPLADKLLVTAALVCLVELGDIAAWMVFVILAREFAITALRSVAASEGIVIAAGNLGKIKTTLQMVAIIAILFKNYPFEVWHLPVSDVLLWAAVLMTIVSGADYIYKSRKLFSM
jgi:CDP-diacylglycerol--glycerol-3-phosphate 3-phosphatidyltransferase